MWFGEPARAPRPPHLRNNPLSVPRYFSTVHEGSRGGPKVVAAAVTPVAKEAGELPYLTGTPWHRWSNADRRFNSALEYGKLQAR